MKILRNKKVYIFIGVALLILATILSAGCVPKKTAATTPATSSTITSQVQDLQTNVKVLEAKVTALTDKVNSMPTSGMSATDLTKLKTDLLTVQSDFETHVASGITQDPAVKALQTKVNELQVKIDQISSDPVSTPIPTFPTRYVIVSNITSRYVRVTNYGTGDYPILVTLFGAGFQIGQADTDPDVCTIEEEYVFGTYTISETTTSATLPSFNITNPATNITIAGDSYTTSNVSAHDHTVLIPNQTAVNPSHSITVPSQSISVPFTDLQFQATMLTIVIKPESSWKNGSTFNIDIRDLTGDVIYATAALGAED